MLRPAQLVRLDLRQIRSTNLGLRAGEPAKMARMILDHYSLSESDNSSKSHGEEARHAHFGRAWPPCSADGTDGKSWFR
jgi:hypothetical protein